MQGNIGVTKNAPIFIRLAINRADRDTNVPQGVFTAAWDLIYDGELTAEAEANLRELLHWFKVNLPSPKEKMPKQTIFWYKSENHELIQKTWELVSLLRYQDLAISLVKTERPGYIIYEDEFQVGAIPFKDSIS
jgi:hypothetical protein